jgi:hypothetical protein
MIEAKYPLAIGETRKHEDPDHRLPNRRDDAQEPCACFARPTVKRPPFALRRAPRRDGRAACFARNPCIAQGLVLAGFRLAVRPEMRSGAELELAPNGRNQLSAAGRLMWPLCL